MPTVKLRFPGGRYHATPWGHHVNEGLIEWPPSPWRLLRAFVACGLCKLGWKDEVSLPDTAKLLILKLAATLPFFRLPSASAAHSRHFMPYIEGKSQKTTLVFDTWANVGNGELLIHWPCELDPEEADLLGKLATALGYLGRSESWVEAQLTEGNPAEWNAVPCQEGEHRGPGWEQVSLMATISPSDYDQWQAAQVQEALRPFQGQKQTTPVKKKQAQAIEPYPTDLLSCLTKDTAWWKGHGWSQPPGSQRVLYWRRNDALQVGVPMLPRRRSASSVECVLLAITTPSASKSALPSVTRTLPQAELLHRAIICRAADGQRINCPSLTGKDSEGRPLRDHHRHAHTIPLDLDGDGHLDHVLIFAHMGLCEVAQRAIRSVNRTWTKGGVGDLQLAVVGNGDLSVLGMFPEPLGKRLRTLIGPPGGGRIWESMTPFVPPRFLKRRGKNTLVGQVAAELESRGMPELKDCIVLPEKTKDLRHFVRRRSRGGAPSPPVDVGYALHIELAEPVCGPFSLGYASHFGLGLFAAVPEQNP